jgi:hypothetical protein
MSLSGFLPAVSRRAIVLGSVAAFVCAMSSSALRAQATAPPPQTAPPQTPAPAAPPTDPLMFTTPAARVIVLSLTADGDSALEAALTMAKDALAKSEKPERKQQAAHWKVWKATAVDGTVSLFFVLDAVVPGVSYNPFIIINEAGLPREQVDPLLARINAGAIKGLAPFTYTPFIDMSGGGGH